ncbi:flagellar biosynthetic protein FliR [Tianweitania sediminis]|uniref:Flagellar biosynthetic protein FliR n=1 Tax=Tianweitania sediminis TaxID=1502156 RepID=A0A8J7R3K2_9HYPH|nr:flagellar biosynthetic protein FliR [Tianweitania sediminis]MBP0441260.1 flagellar type III secretion system protein FliR [Tianweitania sediminis]
MSDELNLLVLTAFLGFCRIGACFIVMPGLSSARVPTQIRLFVAVAITLALLMNLSGFIRPAVDRNPNTLLLLIGSELLVGTLIGLTARIYTLALSFIGQGIATLVGYGAVGGTAIEENEPQAPLASIISLAALLLLFSLDFHHEVVRALVESYQVIPVETLFDPQGALVDLGDTMRDAFMVMLRLGSPFIAYAILVNVAIGFVNKLTPQIPVYFISLPFVIAGGMLLLYFGASTFLTLFGDAFMPVTIGR